jgi:hypothetical protein
MEHKRNTVPVNVAARELGLGKSRIYQLINSGQLRVDNPGLRQTKVFRESIEALKKKDDR